MTRYCAAAAAAAAIIATPALAQSVSDGKVKIGILNDQSGMMADLSGKFAVESVRMAIEDFGGKVKGVRFETLAAICEYLQCQPGDLLAWVEAKDGAHEGAAEDL